MRAWLLALLRVPERPDPPPGSGDELETFRATRGFLRYSVLMWFPKQIAAAIGLYFSLAFFGGMTTGFSFIPDEAWSRFSEKLADADIGIAFLRFDLVNIILFFEGLAIATYVGQLVFTGLLLKLGWELRWYMVGERSLRIRHGLWSVREQTMTIANIQNMVVRQGPLQRLFGFSDLEVHTAGGGSGSAGEDPTQQSDSFHVGRLRGLEDASALRDKIRERLQKVKDEPASEENLASAASEPMVDLASAARSLLTEARALRRAASL